MAKTEGALLCVAPRAYRSVLVRKLKGVGLRVRFRTRPDSQPGTVGSEHDNDPYRLRRITERAPAETGAVVLVVPRNRSARRVCPAPVVNGLPVGLVFSNKPEDLSPWLEGLSRQGLGSSKWTVLAMWKPSYINLGHRLKRWLRVAHGAHVETQLADTTSREELCESLATGPRLIVYVGHGRAIGLSGYRGLRWRHIAAVTPAVPCGTILCFACDTLKRFRGTFPFGCQWVSGGRAGAFFGCVDAVSMKGNVKLVYQFGSVFQARATRSLGELLTVLHGQISARRDTSEALHAFQSYRIIGNPLQCLT